MTFCIIVRHIGQGLCGRNISDRIYSLLFLMNCRNGIICRYIIKLRSFCKLLIESGQPESLSDEIEDITAESAFKALIISGSFLVEYNAVTVFALAVMTYGTYPPTFAGFREKCVRSLRSYLTDSLFSLHKRPPLILK